MSFGRYRIAFGGTHDPPGTIFVTDNMTVIAHSSQCALSHLEEMVRLANRPEEPAAPAEKVAGGPIPSVSHYAGGHDMIGQFE